MRDFSWVLAWIPGVLALIAASVGYGRLVQRIATMERDVAEVKKLSDRVTAIDERTKNMKEDVADVKDAVGKLVDRFIDEGRHFAPPTPPPRRRS